MMTSVAANQLFGNFTCFGLLVRGSVGANTPKRRLGHHGLRSEPSLRCRGCGSVPRTLDTSVASVNQ
jgi:hypothetical protein